MVQRFKCGSALDQLATCLDKTTSTISIEPIQIALVALATVQCKNCILQRRHPQQAERSRRRAHRDRIALDRQAMHPERSPQLVYELSTDCVARVLDLWQKHDAGKVHQ